MAAHPKHLLSDERQPGKVQWHHLSTSTCEKTMIVVAARQHTIGEQRVGISITRQEFRPPEQYIQPFIIVREATYNEWVACCVELGCNARRLPSEEEQTKLGLHYYEIRTD